MKTLNGIRRMLPKLLLVLVGWLSASSASAQGLVEFANLSEGGGLFEVDAPIYDVDGETPLAGPEFLAQLCAAAPGASLQPLGFPTPFSTGHPGYFFGPGVVVPGVGWWPESSAVIQVVAWRASDGATFAAANHLGGHVGESSVFSLGPLGNPGPPGSPLPPPLHGLQSFSLHVVVPEPSVFALGLLGGGVLVLGPRWRRSRARVKTKFAPL